MYSKPNTNIIFPFTACSYLFEAVMRLCDEHSLVIFRVADVEKIELSLPRSRPRSSGALTGVWRYPSNVRGGEML